MSNRANPAYAVGTIHTSNHYGDVVVVEYNHCNDILVKFLSSGVHKTVQANQLSSGKFRDPSKPFIRKGYKHNAVRLVSPTGLKVCVKNVKEFCRYVGIAPQNLYKMITGEPTSQGRYVNSVKGWTLYDGDEETSTAGTTA